MLADDLSVVREIASDLEARGHDAQARALEVVLGLAVSAIAAQSGTSGLREYLTTSQAAAALGVTRQTIKNWVQTGYLRGVVLGGRTFIHRDAVQAQLDRLLAARPPVAPVPGDLELIRAEYESSVKALPAEKLRQLEVLHEQLEAGQVHTPEQRAEMAALEREVTRAATSDLARRVRRRTTPSTD